MKNLFVMLTFVVALGATQITFAQTLKLAAPNPELTAPLPLRQLALLDAINFMVTMNGEFSPAWLSFKKKSGHTEFHGDTLVMSLNTSPNGDDAIRMYMRFWMQDSVTVRGDYANLYQPYSSDSETQTLGLWENFHILLPWPTLPETWGNWGPTISGTFWVGSPTAPKEVYPQTFETVSVTLSSNHTGFKQK